jgi:putative methylase
MQKPLTKSRLAIILSKLAVFEKPKLMSEQYATDSESAAEAMWFAFMNGDIEGKAVADFGSGTGLLGIAALLLGAKKVYFVDSDSDALAICSQNIEAAGVDAAGAKIVHSDVGKFHESVDTVIENPPFGTKKAHADREFLVAAFKSAAVIYSFHKIETTDFVRQIGRDSGFTVSNIIPFEIQLKKTHEFHKSRMKWVKVGLFRMAKG